MNNLVFLFLTAIYVLACLLLVPKDEPEHTIDWRGSNLVGVAEKKSDDMGNTGLTINDLKASSIMIPAEIGIRDDGVIVVRKTEILSKKK